MRGAPHESTLNPLLRGEVPQTLSGEMGCVRALIITHPVPTSRDTPLGEGNELDVFRRVTSPTHRGQDPTEQKNDKVGVVQNYENNDGFQPINLNVKYRGLKPSVIS